MNKNLDTKEQNITANSKAQTRYSAITTVLYGNRAGVLQVVSDPHGIDNIPSVNDNIGDFLDGLGLGPLPDVLWNTGLSIGTVGQGRPRWRWKRRTAGQVVKEISLGGTSETDIGCNSVRHG